MYIVETDGNGDWFRSALPTVLRGLRSRLCAVVRVCVAAPSRTQCVPQMKCIGSQQLYAPLNVCVDLACDDFWFMELDPISRDCRLVFTYRQCILPLPGCGDFFSS